MFPNSVSRIPSIRLSFHCLSFGYTLEPGGFNPGALINGIRASLSLACAPDSGRSVWLRSCTTNLIPVPQYSRGDLWRVHSFIKILFKFRMSRRWRRDEASGRQAKRGLCNRFVLPWPCVSEASSTILISFIDNSRVLRVSSSAREPALFISSPGSRVEEPFDA